MWVQLEGERSCKVRVEIFTLEAAKGHWWNGGNTRPEMPSFLPFCQHHAWHGVNCPHSLHGAWKASQTAHLSEPGGTSSEEEREGGQEVDR